MLRATTACTFSCLIWPAGSAPAALASLLFDPPEPQIIGKTQCFATFLSFRASASSFFLLFLFYSSPLCFSSVHIVGSFTSKLPSIIDPCAHACVSMCILPAKWEECLDMGYTICLQVLWLYSKHCKSVMACCWHVLWYA